MNFPCPDESLATNLAMLDYIAWQEVLAGLDYSTILSPVQVFAYWLDRDYDCGRIDEATVFSQWVGRN